MPGLVLEIAVADCVAHQSAKMSIVSRAPHCRTTLQNGQNQTPKESLKKQPILEYLPGLPQDTKPLRSCSGNLAKMLRMSHHGIKCHFQNNKVIRLHHPNS